MTRKINNYLAAGQSGKGIMFLMDVDHFKSINDTLGHDVGDDVIVQLGHLLGSKFDNNELAGRFGGDEFVVFIKDADDPEVARNAAAAIVREAYESITLPDKDWRVSVSIGVAIYNGLEKDYSEIFKKADIALYRSKADKVNRYCFYE